MKRSERSRAAPETPDAAGLLRGLLRKGLRVRSRVIAGAAAVDIEVVVADVLDEHTSADELLKAFESLSNGLGAAARSVAIVTVVPAGVLEAVAPDAEVTAEPHNAQLVALAGGDG